MAAAFARMIQNIIAHLIDESEGLDATVMNVHVCGRRIMNNFCRMRAICAPNDQTKAVQRALLRAIESIPMHQAAHGFVRGKDSFSCASAHLNYWGKQQNGLVVLNMDAADFFHSVTCTNVKKALLAHNVSESATDSILETCSLKIDRDLAVHILQAISRFLSRNGDQQVPASIARMDKENQEKLINWILNDDNFQAKKASVSAIVFAISKSFLSLGDGIIQGSRFFPQGAPTSPALSNLMMKIVDIRIAALAKKMGGFYTRYADDLTISWPVPTKGKVIDGVYRCIQTILAEYHIKLNPLKKRVMGTSKPQDVVGYMINSGRPTVCRQDRRKLRAALHNEMVRGSNRLKTQARMPFPGEDYSKEYPTLSRVQYLSGMISYIQQTHPEEAVKYKMQLKHITERSVRILPKIRQEVEIGYDDINIGHSRSHRV